MSIETKAVALLALGFAAAHTFAADGRDILKQQCVSCHAVAKPENASLERLWDRKGPDLYYAGAKFNREWLVKWLQNPVAIRPAGVFYGKAVKAGEQKSADVIDTAKVVAHPKLAKDDAAAAADALMTLGANDNLVEKGAFKAGPANASMAAMLFNKLRGCASCHSDKPGKGGSSGPELYTAGERLQPDFIVAYIKNPQKFDPHVWMPKLDLNEADVQKLTGYVATLKQAEAK